jgi:phage shock protein E
LHNRCSILATAEERAPIEFTKDTLEVVKTNVAKKKEVLVDVRSQEEWKKGHLEGSIFLPVDSLRKDVDPKTLATKLPKDKTLHTFCAVGMRAKAVAAKLEKHGYAVRALKPSYDELVKAGFKKKASRLEISWGNAKPGRKATAQRRIQR